MASKTIKAGICAPASHFKTSTFYPAIKFLEKAGIQALYNKAIYKKDLFTAGTPQERTKDLVGFLKRKDINTIFFVRGGYGSAQILPFLDKINLKKYLTDKSFMGFSDITALFSYLYTKYGKTCFYGPNVVSHFFQNKKLLNCIIDNRSLKIQIKVLRRSRTTSIKAPIFGGCLSVLTSLAGTNYLKKLDGHILFIEDTNETPYKIDRMLTQLYQAGIITKIKAIAVGSMEKCDTLHITWKDPILKLAEKMDIPVIYDIRAGHGRFEYAIPLGCKAEIDINKKELRIKP